MVAHNTTEQWGSVLSFAGDFRRRVEGEHRSRWTINGNMLAGFRKLDSNARYALIFRVSPVLNQIIFV